MHDIDKERIGDLCELMSIQVAPRDLSGSLYIGLEHIASGRFVRAGGGVAADVGSSKFRFNEGDVLYSKLRPYLDKAILADADGICTTELLVLRPKGGVDSRFLVGILHGRTFIDYAMSGVTGVQHPRTSWNWISSFQVPRLKPLERRRIGDVLWTLQRAVSISERKKAVLEELTSAFLTKLMAGSSPDLDTSMLGGAGAQVEASA